MTETNSMYAYLDNFIADLLNGNIEIVYSRARSLVTEERIKGWFGRETHRNRKKFSSELGHALTDYQENRTNPALRQHYADDCLRHIIWANTHQVIKRTGLVNRINQFEIENAQLKEEKDKCQKEVARLTQVNEALQQAFDKLGFQRIPKDDDKKGWDKEE
jgi:FtsZ-binding cell division protein ZapB